MPWEHEPQATVSTAFSSSPKLSRVLLSTEYMFSISFRKDRNEEQENNLVTLIIKIKFSLLTMCLHKVIETRFLTNQRA